SYGNAPRDIRQSPILFHRAGEQFPKPKQLASRGVEAEQRFGPGSVRHKPPDLYIATGLPDELRIGLRELQDSCSQFADPGPFPASDVHGTIDVFSEPGLHQRVDNMLDVHEIEDLGSAVHRQWQPV